MPMLNVKVGLQPLTLKDFDFPTICAKAEEAGYVGVECPVNRYLDNLSDLESILSEHGLQCASTYTVVHAYDQEQAKKDEKSVVRVAEALKTLGASVVVVAPTYGRSIPRTVSHTKDEVVSYAERLNGLGGRLQEIGMTMAIHNHVNTILERPEEIDWFSEATDPAKVFWGFDTAQLSAAGADAVEYFLRYADRVRYVHLKDRKIGLETYGNFAELGTGFIHFPSILQILADVGYAGWILPELDESPTPVESIKRNREYLKSLGI